MNDPTAFSIATAERNGRLVVVPRGELDLATSPELEDLVLDRLTGGNAVTLDLRELEFMDSSGVRVLIAAHAVFLDQPVRFDELLEKFVKDLQKRNGIAEIYDQVMNEKVMELLQQNAKIEDVPTESSAPPQPASR